jgi:Yip1 domain
VAALEDSSAGRLIGVLVSPVKTFRSITARPTWAAALVALLIVTTLVGVLANQRIDKNDMRQMVRERIEKSRGGQATPEQMEQAMVVTEKMSSVTRWLIPLFAVVIYLVVAALFFGAFHFFGGSDIPYKTSFAVTLHSFLPGLVAGLLTLPVILSREHVNLKAAQSGNLLASNLGAFAPESLGTAARSLLSSLDFFALWSVVLLVIGYRISAKVSTATAATVVVVLWALYVAAKVGLAALFT